MVLFFQALRTIVGVKNLSVFIESQRTTPAASGLVLWVFSVHPGGFPFSFLICV